MRYNVLGRLSPKLSLASAGDGAGNGGVGNAGGNGGDANDDDADSDAFSVSAPSAEQLREHRGVTVADLILRASPTGGESSPHARQAALSIERRARMSRAVTTSAGLSKVPHALSDDVSGEHRSACARYPTI